MEPKWTPRKEQGESAESSHLPDFPRHCPNSDSVVRLAENSWKFLDFDRHELIITPLTHWRTYIRRSSATCPIVLSLNEAATVITRDEWPPQERERHPRFRR